MCATQLAGGLLLKMLKYFKVLLNIFEFSHVMKVVELVLFMQIRFHESFNYIS